MIAEQMERRAMPQKADYGIDSPAMVTGAACIGAVALCLAIFDAHLFGVRLRWLGVIAALEFLGLAGAMLLYSKSGKMRIRDAILGSLPWRGDERVLDVGCGRGLLLVGAAKRAPNGFVVGVDRWLRGALTGNAPQAVMENAAADAVAARVEVCQGDARHLPFEDSSFDLVVSNFVIHEVDTALEREQMISEMVRVLKPGGRLALADFIFTPHCVEILHKLGLSNAQRKRFSGPGSWLATVLMLGAFHVYIVTAQKSIAATQMGVRATSS